jgi:DUF4097 and DUF4098 domain-containing protein YvlB
VKKAVQFVGTLAVLAFLVTQAVAQQSRVYREGGNWAQEASGSLSAAKTLHVKVDMGAVRIVGGAQQNITYTAHTMAYTSSEDSARKQFEAFKIAAYTRGDTAWITGDFQGRWPHKCSGEFVINVPRSVELVKVETDGGNVVTTGIAGSVEAETGGGSIQVDDIGGSVRAETGGDWIDVGNVGGNVDLQTGGGKITIRAAKGRISASTGGGNILLLSGSQGATLEAGGGNIVVKQCDGHLRVSTGGGNIELGDVGGPVEISTGGGSIRLASAKGMVKAETGAGRIELDGVPSARAETGAGGIVAKFLAPGDHNDSWLETSAGDITVYLSGAIALTIRASIDMANGHRISSDFSDIRVSSEGGDYGPKTITAEGKLNGGGPVLKVRTTTGDIRILRASR